MLLNNTHLMYLKITAIIFYLDFSNRSSLFLFHFYRLYTFLIKYRQRTSVKSLEIPKSFDFRH